MMKRILQSLLVLISLLLLVWMAASANGATWQGPDSGWDRPANEPTPCAEPHLLRVPGWLRQCPQPGSHLQGQPFGYGYFGARARPSYACQLNSREDWSQWSIRRAD